MFVRTSVAEVAITSQVMCTHFGEPAALAVARVSSSVVPSLASAILPLVRSRVLRTCCLDVVLGLAQEATDNLTVHLANAVGTRHLAVDSIRCSSFGR